MTSMIEIRGDDRHRNVDAAYRVRDVAKIFDTSERHIWRLIKRGDLKAERLGLRCIRVFESEIARYRSTLNKQS